MPSLVEISRDREPNEGFGDGEVDAVAADLRTKALAAHNNYELANPIDEITKFQLALQTSKATMPGAVRAESNNNARTKGPSAAEAEWSYMRILKNRLAFRTTENRGRTPNEEQPLDELQGRMTDFRDTTNQLERDQIAKRKKKRALCCIILGVLVTGGVIVGAVFGIKAGGSGEHGIDDEANTTPLKECLLDNLYVSDQFNQLRSLVLENVASASKDVLDTPESYQRAALCW